MCAHPPATDVTGWGRSRRAAAGRSAGRVDAVAEIAGQPPRRLESLDAGRAIPSRRTSAAGRGAAVGHDGGAAEFRAVRGAADRDRGDAAGGVHQLRGAVPVDAAGGGLPGAAYDRGADRHPDHPGPTDGAVAAGRDRLAFKRDNARHGGSVNAYGVGAGSRHIAAENLCPAAGESALIASDNAP